MSTKLSWVGNLSFSSFNDFKSCERRFFYGKVLKHPCGSVESKWGNFGNIVHKCIETGESVDTLWAQYKMYDTDMSLDSARVQVDYARSLGYKFKSQEKLILFQQGKLKFKMLIDGILEDGSILDWKTSTFNTQGLKQYREQLLWYCWGVWKHCGYIPPKAMVVYTKAQKVIDFVFSETDLVEYEKHIFDTVAYQNTKTTTESYKTNLKSCFFCGYKNKCYVDNITDDKFLMVDMSYDHDLVRIETKMPDEFNDIVEEQLSYEIDNKYFVMKNLNTRGVKGFDGIIRMYHNQTTSLGLKSELVMYLNQFAEHKGLRLIISETDNRVLPRNQIKTPRCLVGVESRPYQEDAINHIIGDQISFTEICTGAGKTVIAAEIIRRLGFKTLFVVDRNILLAQTYNEFKKLGLDNLGTVTEGKQDWNDITIASIQTLCKIKDKVGLNKVSECNVVIVDEAHSARSKSYQKLMGMIGAEYRIGLTGTAYSDGNDSLELYKSFGVPHFKIRAIDLINAGYLVRPEIKFLKYNIQFIVNGDYHEVYEQVLQSDSRMELLRGITIKHKKDNILIMVDRLEHVDIISGMIDNAYVITGTTKKKDREDILNTIKSSTGNILISTSGVIQKGVNIPNLDVLVNYSANLGSIKTVQCLGRVLRKIPGKVGAFYYDFEDTHKVLREHTKARKVALMSQGYDV
ncbi:MAG: DEAD/DEAH box helicase family protein [Methanosarcinaceae archaeon]|nr:DEAD/DEAH box helicase family protein [Methanosarcinaceae archaeon]